MSTFISYSSKDREITEKIDSTLRAYGANVFRDIRELNPLDDILEFMDRVSNLDYLIALISKNYLLSFPCAYEFTQFLRTKKSNQILIPILLEDIKFTDYSQRIFNKWVQHEGASIWEQVLYRLRLKRRTQHDWTIRFNEMFYYLRNTKCLEYQNLLSDEFKKCRSILKLFDEEIMKRYNEIKIMQNEEEQEIAFEKLLNDHPGHYYLSHLRGHFYFDKQQYKKAIFYHEKLISKFPKPIEHVLAYYHIGQCYNKMKQFEKSIEVNLKALGACRFSFPSHRGLGDAYLGLNQYDQAEHHYLISHRYEKNDIVCNNLGVIEFERSNYKNAIKWFEESIALKPNDPNAYNNIYQCYKYTGQEGKLREVANYAFKKFPEDSKVLSNYVVYHVVQKSAYDNINGMTQIIEKSLQLDKDNIEANIFFGHLIAVNTNSSEKRLKYAQRLLFNLFTKDLYPEEAELLVNNFTLCCRRLDDLKTLQHAEKKYAHWFKV